MRRDSAVDVADRGIGLKARLGWRSRGVRGGEGGSADNGEESAGANMLLLLLLRCGVVGVVGVVGAPRGLGGGALLVMNIVFSVVL